MTTLEGRAVVVTGAGRGLGRAYAISAAEAGASVMVNDIVAETAERTAEEIRAAGGTAVADTRSVADATAAPKIIAHCQESFGRIDGLVNNAGVFHTGPSEELSEEQVAETIAVNLAGVFNVGRAAIEVMRAAGGGTIVNVSSGSHVGMRNMAVYGATKGGVASLTYCWALDLEGSGIRVFGLSPLALTSMGNVPGLRPPERIAPVVTYLLGIAPDYLNGQVVRFDGRSLGLLNPPTYDEYFGVNEEAWTVQDVVEAVQKSLDGKVYPVGYGQEHPLP